MMMAAVASLMLHQRYDMCGQATARPPPYCLTQNGPHDAIIRSHQMVASIIYTVNLKNKNIIETEGNDMKTLETLEETRNLHQ